MRRRRKIRSTDYFAMKKIFETIEKAACAWLTIYFFLLAIFVVFRLSFTFFLSDYMGDGVTFLEIAEAQYRGRCFP